MLLTGLKIYRLPKANFTGTYRTSAGRAEEYLAAQRGEDVTALILIGALLDMREQVSSIPIASSPAMSLICNGGKEVKVVGIATLRRNFHAIDDFMEAYPDATTFSVPYAAEVVTEALRGLYDTGQLVTCIDCIKYLNPKSWTYFLRYGLVDVPEHDVLEISRRLTKDERLDILRVRHYYELDYPLPEEGMDHCILAAVLERQSDFVTATLLFSAYPSWLVAAMVSVRHTEEDYEELLLTADFSAEEGYIPRDGTTSTRIQDTIINILCYTERTWDEMVRLLRMVGYGDVISGTESHERVYAPFQMDEFSVVRTTISHSTADMGASSIARRLAATSPIPLTEQQALIKLGAMIPQ